MQKPKVLSPSLDMVLSGEKLLRDTMEIPQGIRGVFDTIVEQVASNLDQENVRAIGSIVLSGCGDLYHAALAAEFAFERLTGLCTTAMPAMRMGQYSSVTLPANSVVMAMSYSGRPDRVVETARLAKLRGARVWALTLDETSPLALEAHLCFGRLASAEVSGIGFQLALTILLLIAIGVAERRGTLSPDRAGELREWLRRAPDDMQRTLDLSAGPARQLAERFVEAGHVLFLASGPSFGAAVNGSARVLEAVGWNASAQDTEEWAHLNRWAEDRWSPSLVIAPPGPSRSRSLEVLDAMARLGKAGVAVAAEDDEEFGRRAASWLPVHCKLPEEFSGLVYNLPGELLANQLSILTGRRPYRQDDPAYAKLGEVRWGGSILPTLPRPGV